MNKSILVVDDTRSMRKMVAAVLAGAGYEVAEAEDGVQALELAQSRRYDLVVTDHNMPRMDGVTLVRELRARPDYDAVALIVAELTRQHRAIEALWKEVEPAVKAVARGTHGDLDAAAIHELVAGYLEHAAYEEAEFLPLAQDILGRDGKHMAALGISLHLRHAPQVVGYI